MTRRAGVILAGGRGERLGGTIKANLVVGGQRLLPLVAERLAGADDRLVAHGPHAPESLGIPRGFIAIPDLPTDYAGPLAGLAAALDWAQNQPDPPDVLVLAPVDSPFLPPDYLTRLTTRLDAAALAGFAGQLYPTSSAWRVSAIAGLADAVRAGTAPRSLRRLAEDLSADRVDFPPHLGGDPFANANTPEDLAALDQRSAATEQIHNPTAR
jgi:molybdenum cofactor guanylyltransferase